MNVPRRCHYCGQLPLHQSLGGVKSQGLFLDEQTFVHADCHKEHQGTTHQNAELSILKSGVPISHVDFLAYNFFGKKLLSAETHHLLRPEIHNLTFDLMMSITTSNKDSQNFETYVGAYAKKIKPSNILDHLKCTESDLSFIGPFVPKEKEPTKPSQPIDVVSPPQSQGTVPPETIKPFKPPTNQFQPTNVPRWVQNVTNRKVT